MKRLLLSILPLAVFLGASSMTYGELVFEDDFMGANVDGMDPVNWQWEVAADLIWVEEADDVPEYGPRCLGSGGRFGRDHSHRPVA